MGTPPIWHALRWHCAPEDLQTQVLKPEKVLVTWFATEMDENDVWPHPRARGTRGFLRVHCFGGGWLGGGVAPVFHDDSPWFFPVGFVDFSYFLIDRPPPILCAGYFWCREFSEARSGALGVTPPLTTRRTGCLFFHGFFRWPWQLVTYHHIIHCIENIYLVYRWFKPPRKGYDMLQTPRIRKNASWNSPLDGPSRKEMWLQLLLVRKESWTW